MTSDSAPAANLGEVFRPFTNVRLAREDEGARLSALAREQLMRLESTGIGFDRGADFFALFRSYTPQFWVFAILNDDGSIAGLGSLTRFPSQIQGKLRWIGYFGDLRVEPRSSPRAHQQWREAYAGMIRHLEDPRSPEHCDHLITAVFQENRHALQVFQKRLPEVRYHELAPYWNLSVFNPFTLTRARPAYQVAETDREAVLARPRPALSPELGTEANPGETPDRWCALLARDPTAPPNLPSLGAMVFDSRDCRRLRVHALGRALRFAFGLLGVFSPLTYTEAEPWVMKSLACLSWSGTPSLAEQTQALSALIQFVFKAPRKTRDFHFLNLTLMGEPLARQLHRRYPLSRLTSGWLFEVTSTGRTPRLKGLELAFEGAFL